MTGFIIFFIVLTVLYVIYYALMIGLDLRKQEKAGSKEEEENFDVSDIAGQAPESVPVKTTAGGEGFQVGDSQPQQLEPADTTGDYQPEPEESHEPTAAEKHAEACLANMEEINPMDNEEYSFYDGSVVDFITKDQKEKILIKENTIHDKL